MDYRALALEALEKREGIVKAAEDESRSLTEAEAKEVADLETEARGHVEAAEREEAAAELRAKASSISFRRSADSESRGGTKDDAHAAVNADLRSLYMGEKREISITTNDAELRLAKTNVAGNAAEVVPSTFVPTVLESLREQSPIFGKARVLTTSSGEKMDWPVKTSHVSNAAKVAEGVAYGKGDLSVDLIESTVEKYGVIVEVSEELVKDSKVDIATLIAEDAGEQVGRLAATDAVAALLAQASAGPAFATAADITADELLDAFHSLRTPYRANADWLFNDATALYMRKNLKNNDGDYIWQDENLSNGYDKRLLTRPVSLDYNVPTIAANAQVMAFGDLRKFLIRQVGDIRVVRSTEYGFDRDVVAFKVTWRGGFLVTDTEAIKTFAMGAV